MTRWVKVWRDVATMPGRLVVIVAALAVSLAGVIAMLSTYLVLTREVPRNYTSSRPASAQFEVPAGVSTAALARVRALPGVLQASPGRRMGARLRGAGGTWVPLLLFVRPQIERDSVNMVTLDTGAWPAAPGAILIERSALAMVQRGIGDVLHLELGAGRQGTLRFEGTVHDPGVAPAWQEQTVYGYVDAATLAALGDTAPMNRLNLLVRNGTSIPAIEVVADTIVRVLEASGTHVTEVHVPPPGRHPHQTQMDAVLRMLLQFSLLGLVLGAVLTATIISGLLAQHVRQIAMMKAIGASTWQVAALYLAMVGVLGLGAVVIGAAVGYASGRALISVVAGLLNLQIASFALPWWFAPAVIVASAGAPLLAALPPILRASRRTVRSALGESGAGQPMPTGLLTRSVTALPLGSAALTLAVRNTIRQRRRTALTATLLALAGAMLMTALDLRAAWHATVATAARDRRYALEMYLTQAQAPARVFGVIRAVRGVAAIEAWDGAEASVASTRSYALSREYPDGGHGGFTLRSAPTSTMMIAHQLVAGRWLDAADRGTVVLNTLAWRNAFADRRVGDRIAIRTGERVDTLQLVGITREHLTPGAAYVAPAQFRHTTDRTDAIATVRVALVAGADADTLAPRISAALATAGIEVSGVTTEGRLGAAQGGHVFILVAALGAIAVIMTIVGLLGLSSSLGIAVVERTREFAVLRAIGATPATLRVMVVAEGLVLAALAWILSVPLSLVISRVVGSMLARISAQDLEPRLTVVSTLTWLALVAVSAGIVSVFPAQRAARLTIRESLSFT